MRRPFAEAGHLPGHLPCLRLIGRIVYDMDKEKMMTKTIVVIKQIRGGLKMSDEKRREELKAKINEQLDKLSMTGER